MGQKCIVFLVNIRSVSRQQSRFLSWQMKIYQKRETYIFCVFSVRTSELSWNWHDRDYDDDDWNVLIKNLNKIFSFRQKREVSSSLLISISLAVHSACSRPITSYNVYSRWVIRLIRDACARQRIQNDVEKALNLESVESSLFRIFILTSIAKQTRRNSLQLLLSLLNKSFLLRWILLRDLCPSFASFQLFEMYVEFIKCKTRDTKRKDQMATNSLWNIFGIFRWFDAFQHQN